MRLCVAQCHFHFAHLQHLVGVCGAYAQALSAVHNVFAQSQGQVYGALFGLLVADGIIVDAACHTADDRIETCVVLLAHHFLQDDGHLFLVNHVAGGGHVVLAAAVEHAGIDRLDGVGQHGQTVVLVADVRYHVSAVHTGKGLVMAVFQQTAASDSDGLVHHLQKGFKVGQQAHGQSGAQELFQNLFIGQVAQCGEVKFVGVHEFVKDIGTQYHGLRNPHMHARLAVQVGMAFQNVVDEGQAASLSA